LGSSSPKQTGKCDWEIKQQQRAAHARFVDMRYFIEVDHLSLKEKRTLCQRLLQTDHGAESQRRIAARHVVRT